MTPRTQSSTPRPGPAWASSLARSIGLVPLLILLLISGLAPGCGGGEEGDTIYWCSMHPDVRQPEPGECPLCGGMRLVPLDESLLGGEPGVLKLSDVQVQQAGVRLASVEVRDLVRALDMSGRFTLNPRSEVSVHNPIPGSSRVAVVHYQTAGEWVKEGSVLLELENELLAQQIVQLRDAVARYEDLKEKEGSERQAQEMLKRKDAIQSQLEDAGVDRTYAMALAHEGRRRESTPRFPVRATQQGVILRTPVVEAGRYSRQGEALFRIADTTQLWLELEAHERDLAWLQRGLRVRYESAAVPGEELWTTLDAVETVADTGRLEIRVRARATSRKGRILPGTRARASVQVEAPGIVAVPTSAVMRTGGRDVALIAEGGGRFRPLALTIGRRDLTTIPPRPGSVNATARVLAGTRYHEVLHGLSAGDRVVTAGSFLLLSEASFQGALEKLLEDQAESIPTSPELASALDVLLASYEELRVALAADDPAGLAGPVSAIGRAVLSVPRTDLPASTSGALTRLADAAREIEGIPAQAIDLEETRILFGTISREVVALVRSHARERVVNGQLYLFRCPMADDYGFDLWFQAEAEMGNPYMGLRMLECGSEAQL